MKNTTKLDILLITVLCLSAFVVYAIPAPERDEGRPPVEIQRLQDDSITGAFVREGIIEYTEQDGKKAYWITGKALRELVKQYEKEAK